MYQYLLDTDIFLYDVIGPIGFVALVIFNFANIRKKKEFLSYAAQFARDKIENSPLKNKFLSSYTPWTVVEIFILCIVQFAFVTQINISFGKMVGTGGNYFGLMFFEPFILIVFCLLVGIHPLKQLDILTPAFPLALIFTKISCFCAGCCNGAEWEYGLYNHAYNRVEFPVQLLEAALALLIFIFLLFYRKKAKEGTLFPIYLILYSTTRFFSEFTKDNLTVFWILKIYHVLCLIGIVVGIVELLLVHFFRDKIDDFFDKHKFIPKQEREKLRKEQAKNKKVQAKNKKMLAQKSAGTKNKNKKKK